MTYQIVQLNVLVILGHVLMQTETWFLPWSFFLSPASCKVWTFEEDTSRREKEAGGKTTDAGKSDEFHSVVRPVAWITKEHSWRILWTTALIVFSYLPFRVAFSFCARQVIVPNSFFKISFPMQILLILCGSNSFSNDRTWTKTRFNAEAQSYLEIG